MEASKYYSNGPLLSYHAFLNFLIGHRGVGKTFNFKEWCIKDYIKNGAQFMWVRRYKSETKKLKQFTDDLIKEGKFLDHKIEIKGGDDSGRILVDDKVAGYYCTLSISLTYKSVPYPYVDKIIFDEFLIKKGNYHYLPDEVITFLELVDTVFRDRDDNVRGVYLLANNISFTNPYFLYFNIKPFKGRFYRGDEFIVEKYRNEAYIEHKYNTRFGRLVKGTPYGDYAIENESLVDNETFICKRSQKAKFRFCIKYKDKTIGLWLDADEGKMYASWAYDPTTLAKYCITREDHEPNLYLIKNLNNTHLQDLKYLFQIGELYFEDAQIKSITYEILSYFIR